MSKNLYKGNLDTIILQLLSKHDKLYGYEMTQMVKDLTQNKVQITEGALYPALHKLKEKGFLEVEVQRVDNRLRKYYKLTNKGTEEMVEKISELESFIANMKLILNHNPQFS